LSAASSSAYGPFECSECSEGNVLITQSPLCCRSHLDALTSRIDLDLLITNYMDEFRLLGIGIGDAHYYN